MEIKINNFPQTLDHISGKIMKDKNNINLKQVLLFTMHFTAFTVHEFYFYQSFKSILGKIIANAQWKLV